MNKLDNKAFQFCEEIYRKDPIFITCDKFWDGGIKTDSSLEEKSEFYCLSSKMSCIIQDIITILDERVFIGKSLCENGELYARWSDLKKYELFQEISDRIHRKKHYEILMPEDADIVDLIVESNFRYFSYIALYLSKSDMIVLPTCHTEVLIYTKFPDKIMEILNIIVEKYSDDKYKICVKKTD